MSNTSHIQYFNNASKLYKAKLYEEALGEYERSVKEDLTFYEGHFGYAKTLVRLNRDKEALDYFSKYMHLIPEEEKSEFVIAFSNLLMKNNQIDFAKEVYINARVTEKNTLEQLHLPLLQGDIVEIYKNLIDLKDGNQAEPVLSKLYERYAQTPMGIEQIKSNKIIPRYYFLVDSIRSSNNLSFNDINLELLEQIKQELRDFGTLESEEDFNSKINEIESNFYNLQQQVYNSIKENNSVENLKDNQDALNWLQSTNFKEDFTVQLGEELAQIRNKSNKKRIKKFGIIGGIAALLLVGATVTYVLIQQSQSRSADLDYEIKKKEEYLRQLEGGGSIFDSSMSYAEQCQKTIKDFVQAEDNRDFNKIYSYFSPNIERYWDLSYPTKNQLKNRYNSIWSRTSETSNRILSIEQVDENTFDMTTEYSYYHLRKQEYFTTTSTVRYKFDPDNKITYINEL